MATTDPSKRRARLRRLLHDEPGLSNRAAARRLGVDHKTVARDLAWLEDNQPDTLPVPPAPPEAGNQRALVHGAKSEQRLAPLREQFATEILQSWPWIDDARRAILADRFARLESARRWLDEQASVVRDGKGDPWPIASSIDKWESRTLQLLRELDEEARLGARGPAAGHVNDLAGALRSLSADDRRQIVALLDKAKAEAEQTAEDAVDGTAEAEAA